MNENIVKIALDQITVQAYINRLEDRIDYLEKDIRYSDSLKPFLQQYLSDRWTVEEIGIIEIDEHEESENGSLNISFDKDQYNGCSGSGPIGAFTRNGSNSQDVDCSYEIDIENAILILYGDEIRSRSTVDEF